MPVVLNVLWFLLGGWVLLIGYLLGAALLCITIVGIPFGLACFKLAVLAAAPFGHHIREKQPPSGPLAIVMNILWILLPGLELAIVHLILAAAFAITIIGLPFAAQHLKMTRLALLPFGFETRKNT
jgi:uncharacterized membrane protein YccF (DUF307 family)